MTFKCIYEFSDKNLRSQSFNIYNKSKNINYILAKMKSFRVLFLSKLNKLEKTELIKIKN